MTSVSEVTIELNAKDVLLVRSKLSKMKNKMEDIVEPMVNLVATQKEEIMKELAISKALILLNDKQHVELTIKTQTKLNAQQTPPTSIRFGTKLTSPIPEVVASPLFREYRDQFNAGLGTFQDLAFNLFKKTKALEREIAEQKLRASFNEHFHKLIETKAGLELIRMPSTRDIEIVKELGGHDILVAHAWKNILNKAATPSNANECNNSMQTTVLNDLAAYLRISTTELKTELNSKFTTIYTDTNTRASVNTALAIQNINTTIEKLEHYIITISDKLTTLIYENYAKKLREKEATDKIRAEIKAQEISKKTTTVNDILDAEDTISSPKMIDFINQQIQKGISNYAAKNSPGQSKTGKNNSTNKNNKNNYKNNNNSTENTTTQTTITNNTNENNSTSKQSSTSKTVTFTPNNGNKKRPLANPYNLYNTNSYKQNPYQPRPRHQRYNNNNNNYPERERERERERKRDYHDDYHRRRDSNYRR